MFCHGLKWKNLSQKPADFSGEESIWPEVDVYVWVNLMESLCSEIRDILPAVLKPCNFRWEELKW